MYQTECLTSNINEEVRMLRWMSSVTTLERIKNEYNIMYNTEFRSNKDIAEKMRKPIEVV